MTVTHVCMSVKNCNHEGFFLGIFQDLITKVIFEKSSELIFKILIYYGTVHSYISQDYGLAYCHRTIDEKAWLPFQKGKTDIRMTVTDAYMLVTVLFAWNGLCLRVLSFLGSFFWRCIILSCWLIYMIVLSLKIIKMSLEYLHV